MFSPNHVPRRTPLGEACAAAGDTRATGRQRQFLRLIDGQRRLDQLATMLPGRDLPAECAELLAQGFIAPAATAAAPVAAASAPVETLPARWLEAMAFMKAQAAESLGVMSHSIVGLLEKARDSAAARSAVARWHMALRESRSGRAQADAHLQVVTEMLNI